VSAAAESSSTVPGRLPRLLLELHADDRAVSLDAHLRRFGPPVPRGDLIALVEASGLRGRGGAGFPTGTKLAAVAAQPGRPIVVVNAAEGEPANVKDKALLRHSPHLVLDGAVLASVALGARTAVIAVSAAATVELARVEAAIAERRKRRLDRVTLRVATVPDRFVTGEETALLRAVAGRPAKPALKPPFPFERGLDNRPTLVQNAETLAQLALIARYGARWFREAGTVDAPGTALVTLSGAVARRGVHEIEFGVTVGDLLARAGGVTEPFSAVLVGGYFGGWIGAADIGSHRLLPETLGAGAIVVFPASACAVAECARVLRYLAGESAGQCGPCVHGLAAIADGFGRLALGKDSRPETLRRWADMVAGRGACRHPDGAARFLTSSLTVFADELARHARNGVCGRAQRPILPLGSAG
jgi:NADH:ubiquinone oxidoreductase subunit F (NADH-binding)